MMMEFHANGVTIEEIEKVLHRVPIHHRIVPAIKAAYALGCDLRVVSDANMFYIETILKHLGISEYFSEINTNPGYVNEEGRVRISPYHDFNKCSHGCTLCPPNMCKVYFFLVFCLLFEATRFYIKKYNKNNIYLGSLV
jgi:pyridoxal phosphate phosphatase PHOSPHO2